MTSVVDYSDGEAHTMADEEYNTVSSEVHHFSKEEVIDAERGGDSKKQDCEAEVNKNTSNTSAESDEEFECHLGGNGQVVLWSSRRETVLSRFDFVVPEKLREDGGGGRSEVKPDGIVKPAVDSDGDLDVVRRNKPYQKEAVLLIEHQSATTLDLVGEQVWRGALFLGDFLLHQPQLLEGTHVLEVASGVGLTSLVAAMLAKKVTITDIDRGDILDLIHRNLKRNTELIKADVSVKEIDFFNHTTIDDIEDDIKDVSLILAADVVYHNQLTDAYFDTMLRLMSHPPDKTLYVALEKRYVFTVEDMDTVAPCYEYFLQKMDWLKSQNLNQIEWNIEELESNFDQYFTYERTRHLVLWKIHAKLK